ncbi:MAG: SAM-dependent methyltransferase [Bacteroidia bacterium]|jgi:SAM-dependent methyltransferase
MLNKTKKNIKKFLLTKLLNGTNVQCNICNKGFSTYLSYLDRLNAKCPNCESIERTRLVWHFITDKKLIGADAIVLHVAPEKALFDKLKNATKRYLPIDKFEEGYSYPSITKEMDVTDLKLENEQVDGIICMHVLEHVLEDRKALSEFYRVLKPGGWAIIQVPFEEDREVTYEDPSILSKAERKAHFGQTDHVRVYGTDYLKRFVEPGFVIEELNYEKSISDEIKFKLQLKKENIFLMRKPKA